MPQPEVQHQHQQAHHQRHQNPHVLRDLLRNAVHEERHAREVHRHAIGTATQLQGALRGFDDALNGGLGDLAGVLALPAGISEAELNGRQGPVVAHQVSGMTRIRLDAGPQLG